MADMKVNVLGGDKASQVNLPASVFGCDVNVPLIHQVVVAQLAAARQGTHATKTRGMVSGGGAKPWRQKGTGRARHGSRRSPQWTGGGVVHGPQPRSYAQRTPKKMIAAALRSALSERVADGKLFVVDNLVSGEPSTREALKALSVVGDYKSAVVVLHRDEDIAWLSLRNVPTVHAIAVDQINTYDIVSNQVVVFTSAALEEFISTHEASTSESKPVVVVPGVKPKTAKVTKTAKAKRSTQDSSSTAPAGEEKPAKAPKVETPAAVVEQPVVEVPEVPGEEPVMETPVVETPVVETAEVEVLEVETPVVEIPEVEIPVVEVPEVEVPEVEVPIIETPQAPVAEALVVEIPEVEAPVAEIPVVETPEVEIVEVEVPVVEVPVIETPEVETPVVEKAATVKAPAAKATTAKATTAKATTAKATTAKATTAKATTAKATATTAEKATATKAAATKTATTKATSAKATATKATAKDVKADPADKPEYEGGYRGDKPPAGYDIKGNEDSMKYHTTESRWYKITVAEVWFNSEEAAKKAGFVNVMEKK